MSTSGAPADPRPRGARAVGVDVLSCLLASALMAIAAYLPLLLSGRIGRDSGVFVYTGMVVAEGGMPYVDSWDHKGPLLALLNTLAWRLGLGTVGVVVLEAALYVAGLAVAALLWARWVGRTPALVGVGVLGLSYLAVFEGGNFTETWLLPVQLVVYTIVAVVLSRRRSTGRTTLALGVLLGLALAVAALTRVNNGAGLLVVAVACLVLHGRRAALVAGMLAGAAIAIVPVVAWLWSGDALRAAVEQYLVYNSFYAGGATLLERVAAFGALGGALLGTTAGVVGLIVLALRVGARLSAGERSAVEEPLRSPRGRVIALFAAVFAADAASQLLAGRDYTHYAVVPLAALVLLVVLAWGRVEDTQPSALRRLVGRGDGYVAALAAVGGIALIGSIAVAVDRVAWNAGEGLFVAGSYQRILAEEVRQNTSPDDTVLVHGAETWILAASERRSPTSITYSLPIEQGYGGLAEQYLSDVESARPRYIVESPESCGLSIECEEGGENFVEFAEFVRDGYTVVDDAFGYRFWRRIDG